jgi:hypothetical protein
MRIARAALQPQSAGGLSAIRAERVLRMQTSIPGAPSGRRVSADGKP